MTKKTHENLAYYRTDVADVLKQLDSMTDGISTNSAKQRLERYGKNRLEQLHKESALHKYLKQYKDLMIILLIACAAIAFLSDDFNTGVILIVLIMFNTLIGFSQEYKAEKLMESLERLVVAGAKVLRNGKLTVVESVELVPGDVVYMEEGDSIPADLRLTDISELSTNDFALTGESNPSRKFTHAISAEVELANRHNLVFMGTTVAVGHGYGVVVATGMQTELGRIASLSADTSSESSPLQREMNHIATRVTQGTMILCAVLLPTAIYFGLPFKGALLFAIGIASSIIPQGLPAEINTALAQAANKLAKARTLVKKLSAVESLGATSIICTDKTGTLTKNQMTVEDILVGYVPYAVSGTGYETNGSILDAHGNKVSDQQRRDNELFFVAGVLANNASVNQPDDEHADWYVIGDPTEGALITLARKAGFDTDELRRKNPEHRQFSFDSARKLMSTVREYGPDKQLYVFLKGAPESVLEKSHNLLDRGTERAISKADSKILNNQHLTWAESAKRNLAYAYKILPAGTDVKKLKMEEVEKDLTFLGLVSMVDPLRDEVPEAMRAAEAAHIKVSIITGDFAPTAKAIAMKAGLNTKSAPTIVVSGTELRQLDDSRVLQLVTRGGVIFSRVSPEDKLRIVTLVKQSGRIVAVTGDGINDAPALKRADIGVAMGQTGTDVAKQSAEIILLDDSFMTLVNAVQQGRVIYQNIKKGTLSCFTSNSAELVASMVSLLAFILFDIPLALTIMQILAIDIIAELFPIAALGWDKADSEVMSEKPRDPKNHILNKSAVIDLLWSGLLIGGLAFTNYVLFFWRNGVTAASADQLNPELYLQATTLTYITIVVCQLLNILQRRSARGLFTRYQLHNRTLGFALLFSVTAVLFIVYNPVIAPYFGSGFLNIYDWLFALLAAVMFVGIREWQLRYKRARSL